MILILNADPLQEPRQGALLECDNFTNMFKAVIFSLCAQEAYKKFEEWAVSKAIVIAGKKLRYSILVYASLTVMQI